MAKITAKEFDKRLQISIECALEYNKTLLVHKAVPAPRDFDSEICNIVTLEGNPLGIITNFRQELECGKCGEESRAEITDDQIINHLQNHKCGKAD